MMVDVKMGNQRILAGLGLAALAGAGYLGYANHVARTDPEVEVQMSGSLQSGFTCRVHKKSGFIRPYYRVTYDPSTESYREELAEYGDIFFGDAAVTLIDDFPSDGSVDSIILDWIHVKDPLMGEYWGVATEYSVDGSPALEDEQRELASETMAKWRAILKVEERCLTSDKE